MTRKSTVPERNSQATGDQQVLNSETSCISARSPHRPKAITTAGSEFSRLTEALVLERNRAVGEKNLDASSIALQAQADLNI